MSLHPKISFARQSVRQIALCLVIAILCEATVGCRSYSNLSDYKTVLIQYYESGQYERDIESKLRPAERYLSRRTASGGDHLAIVFDIDDTALSDWEFTKDMYLGYNKDAFDQWAQKGSALAIKPVLRLYDRATELHLKVFFISARKDHLRSATERNLLAAGYTEWGQLIMQPENGPRQSTAIFKAAARRNLQSQGYKLIANVGDQLSDLEGGFSERNFKIPNPFYTVSW
jgi:acid phosphatase